MGVRLQADLRSLAHRKQWRIESYDSGPGMGQTWPGACWGGSREGGGGLHFGLCLQLQIFMKYPSLTYT